MDEWVEQASDDNLTKIVRAEELFKIFNQVIGGEVIRLKEDALTYVPTENSLGDAHASGYRHGRFVGLTDVLELYKMAKEVLEQREANKLLDKEKE